MWTELFHYNFFVESQPFIEYDGVSGCILKNLNGFSIVSNSSKDSCKYLLSSLKSVETASSNSIVTLQFDLSKVSSCFSSNLMYIQGIWEKAAQNK